MIISEWGEKNILTETTYRVEDVRALADLNYSNNEMGARISSGSFRATAMVVVPCSMKSLAAISCGFSEHLIARAAEVMLKEHRPLVIVPRETPLNAIELENMLKLARLGVSIMPPVPSFYHHPKTLEDLYNHFTGRVLDLLGIDNDLKGRWNDGLED